MNWMEFVLALSAALAWPIVALVIIVVLKRDMNKKD